MGDATYTEPLLSDFTLNTEVPLRDPKPLLEALHDFGQGWLVKSLGDDVEVFHWVSQVPDWGLGNKDPTDPKLDPQTIALMVAFAVEEISHVKAPGGGPGPGLVSKWPSRFVKREADLAAWATLAAPGAFTQADARRLWARRVALSLYLDGANLLPWRSRDFPVWQVSGMMSWRPTAANSLNDVFGATWRGHSPCFLDGSYKSHPFVWDPDPMTLYTAASSIIAAAGAKTPRAALRALRAWMVQQRALHGQQEWNWFASTDDVDGPPGGVFERHCNSPGGSQPYFVSSSQWLRRGWGGCGVNSVVLAAMLRSVNVPAAAISNVCIDDQTQLASPQIPPSQTAAWSTSLRVAGSVAVNVAGGVGSGHNTCYAFGAGLACSHGDQNVNGIGGGAPFGDTSLSGWLPWRLQASMHEWACAADAAAQPGWSFPSASVTSKQRKRLLQALTDAAEDPEYGASLKPHLSWMLFRVPQVTALNWLGSDPGGGPNSLRDWLLAVSRWPCGQPLPALRGMAALLGRFEGALPPPRWSPLFNSAFAATTELTRQALARSLREVRTPMSGLITSEPAALPREAYTLQIDGESVEITGSVAARILGLAIAAREALLTGEPTATNRIRLLAAHSLDLVGLTGRAASGPSWVSSTWPGTVHGQAFRGEYRLWFAVPSGVGLLPAAVCASKKKAMDTFSKSKFHPQPLGAPSAGPPVTSADLADDVNVGTSSIASVTSGADPLNFVAWGPGAMKPCDPVQTMGVSLDNPSDLVAVVTIAVHAILDGASGGKS